MKKTILLAVLGTIVAVLAVSLITFSNQEVDVRNRFEGKLHMRTSFYDNIHKIISQKVQISNKVDDSFKENVNIIMSGRKDSENVMMKWITESNPNANFEQVSILYQDLARTIEAKRMEFVTIESQLADIEREHKNLIGKFPNVIFASILGKEPLNYAPVKSEETERIMQTGIDNNVKLDL